MYGLKQASRQWNSKFTIALLGLGFSQSKSNYLPITKKTNDSFIALLVDVNDILLASSDFHAVQLVTTSLSDQFKLKDLDPIKYFLGMEIAQSKKDISLCQRKYILEILSDVGLLGCKPKSFPMDPHNKLSNASGELLGDVTT